MLPRSSVKSTVRPSRERDTPRAVALGEQEDGAAERLPKRARRAIGLPAGDVDVEHRAAEQLVADGAADDVGLLACDGGADLVIHRRRSGRHGPAATGSRT